MSLRPDQGQAETAQLARRLGALVRRRPGVALGLWGEAGIGKTHAAHELLRAIPCRSVRVQAVAPLPDLLRAIPRPRRLSTWLERTLEQVQTGQELTHDGLLLAFCGLLVASAPFVLHVEDLHEADTARAGWWTAVGRALTRTQGVGLLVTSRLEPPEPFEAVRLRPLDRTGSDALLEAEAGASLPPGALSWIWRRAGGHPLFTLEYFRFLARRGLAWNDGRAWRWREPQGEALPVAVEALVERALHDAGAGNPDRAAALEAAALLGDGVAPEVWAEVAGLEPDQLHSAQAGLERTGLLVGGTLAHPLYREVSLRGLPLERRRQLARRALAALRDWPMRAVLFAADAGLAPAEILAWHRRAAEAARTAGQPVRAARFEAAAVAYASGEERAGLAFAAARALRRVDQQTSLQLAEVAARGPGHGEAAFFLAHSLASRGELAEALRRLEEAPPGPLGRPGQCLILHALAGDAAGAVALWHAHPGLARVGDPDLLCQAAFALSGVGDQQAAWQVVQAALALPDLEGEQRCKLLQVCGAVQYRLGDYTRQEALTAEALALARQTGQPFNVANTLYNRARALAMLARYPEALAALQEAAGVYADIGDARNYGGVQVFRADLLQGVMGDHQAAEDLLLDSRELWLQSGWHGELVECEAVLSELYTHWEAPHAAVLALKHAHAALEAGHQQGSPLGRLSGLLALARAETGQGHPERGLERALEAQEAAEQLQLPWAGMTAQIHRAGALEALGRRGEALEAYGAALEAAHSLALPTETHLIGLELDRLRADQVGLANHLAYFEAQGLPAPAQRTRHLLRRLTAGEQVATRLATDMRLELLGELRLSDGGGSRPLRGRRRQELLALLAEARLAGRAEVGRLDLLDTLYPDTPEAQAAAALRDLVHQLRADFGAGTVLTTAQGYSLGELELDAAEFLTGGDTRLWRGPYLAGLEPREDNVRDALYLALRTRAETLISGDPVEAARLARLWLEAEPYDRGALRLTLQAMRAGNNHRGLGREYGRARTRLLEVGDHLPERWADFLADPTGA